MLANRHLRLRVARNEADIVEGRLEEVRPLSITDVSRIHLQGGSVIRTSRANPTVRDEDADDPEWRLHACLESLRKLGKAFGTDFTVKVASHGGRPLTFPQLARDLAERLISIFVRDQSGQRPAYGGTRKFQDDPHWRDHMLFHEYFHGNDGAGLGASHQTGWTALVASLLDEWRK